MKNFLSAASLVSALLFFPVPAQADTGAARQYVDKVATEALGTITNPNLSKAQKQAKLDKMFAQEVDIPWVGRFVMGRFWREATEDQKKRYLKEYADFIIRHYTTRFTNYTSGKFEITGSRQDKDGEYMVSMQIQSEEKDSQPIFVDYRVRAEKSGFKVFDIIVEGVSLITTQRSEFNAVLSRHGIDYLITQLKNKAIPVTVNGQESSAN